ncbi:c-type cytochrome [Reinekea blandensis]|uniref:Putative cytochrome c5 n=1 Tax=Reinekea blandensis MED297 TaxID=314283 RepID=A4B9A6_9GAMM|nr:c-type cytochrome [Reinekea blandensis]EAR11207.1 putative cytochrome c5 [Reinekea sp. MED297] [Reinekea blandensis MED297]
MKKLLVIVATLALGWAMAETTSYEDAVADRLKPAGNVCVQGEPCETAATVAAAVSSGPKSGDEVYSTACAACHASGALNAPIFGDAAAWEPRVAKGVDTLYDHAINGFNTMPAKGGNASLSDEEVQAAVDHMVAAVQ